MNMVRIADMTNVWENVISHLEELGYDRKLQILPNLCDYIDERCPGLLVVSEVEFEEEYEHGKADGFYDGKAKGYELGFGEGFEKGVEEGHKIGRDRGYEEGFDVGAKKGFTEGHDQGYDLGYRSGYEEGFDYGVCK
jgi:hypothetical protein